MNDLSFNEIARLFERKQAAAMVTLAHEARPIADGWMTFGGRGSYVNKACGLGLDREVPEQDLDALISFFTSRGMEPRVELCPFVPPSLLQALARKGFALMSFENVLVRRLREGDEPRARLPQGWPAGVTVERVDPADDAAVREYVEVSGSGFLPEGEPLPEVWWEAGLKAARLPTSDAYVARVGRETVGAGGCESSSGLTALFGTSVKPAWRRRGIQQALMVARLERGRELGSRLATIVSQPGIPTERNAVRLGFTMAYTRVVLVKRDSGLPLP